MHEQMNSGAESTELSKVSLEELLEYRFEDLTDAFQEKFEVTANETEEVFVELLKFLWLSEPGTTKDTSLCVVEQGMTIMDEMWHLFIQFTVEYERFCHNYFGRFIHHAPTTPREKRKAAQGLSVEETTRRTAAAKRRYETIYELLGRETFIKWFHKFPERYPIERVWGMRRQ